MLKKRIDYYPFGMPMPNRIFGKNGYRYAFQGQEKDPETGKEAFQLRLWDSRIGRWLTTDPYNQFSSPYLGMGNNPITGIDKDGGCVGDDCPPAPGLSDGAIVYNELPPSLEGFMLDLTPVKQGDIVNSSDINDIPGFIKNRFEFELIAQDAFVVVANGGYESSVARSFKNDQRVYSLSNKPGTVDCSKFCQEVSGIVGYNIPRVAYNQANWYKKNGQWFNNISDARPGDHIFWERGVKKYHTGIVLDVLTSSKGIKKITVIQSQVNKYRPGSIQIKTLLNNGQIPYFNQPFVGLGRK